MMWKPAEVVPEHRWRARIVWSGLLLSITAYTMWQVWKIYDGYNHISTELEVNEEVYEFPYLTVCFDWSFGCDSDTATCAETALENAAVNFNDMDYPGIITSQGDSCIGFDLAQLNVVDRENTIAKGDGVLISVVWIASQTASTESFYTESIRIYTSEGEPTEENTSFLYVPYTRVVPGETVSASVADVTIGKTTKRDLDDDVKIVYPPLVLSSTPAFFPDIAIPALTGDLAIGLLNILLRQGSFSRTSLEEISPLDVGAFLGNVGGFWELLIIFWGLLFIATREERSPKLKARDFAKSLQVGKDVVTRRRSLSVDSAASAARSQEQHHWESAYGGRSSPPPAPPVHPSRSGATAAGGTVAASGIPVIPSAIGSSAATRRASNATSTASGSSTGNGQHRQHDSWSLTGTSGGYKRPVESDAPRRGSVFGGSPPTGQAPPPPSYFNITAV